MDNYDVIIIGTGAGGGTLARHLAPSGKRILLLERGDWLPRELENWDAEAVFVDNRYVSPTLGTTRTAGRSSPESTTTSAARQSSTAPRCSGCARRTSASCGITTGSRRRGRSPTTSSSRTTPWRSSSTRCTEPAARIRPNLPQAGPTPPRGLARTANPATRRRPDGGRLPPVPRSLRDHARRVEPSLLAAFDEHLRRLRLPRPCEVGCGGTRGAPRARAPERDPAHELEGHEARHERGGNRGHGGRRRPGRLGGAVHRRHRRRSCGAANSAKLLLQSASEKHANGLANGSDQVGRNCMFHDSTAVLALSREENAPPSRRRLPSTTSTSAAMTSSIRSAASRWSASRRRRCSAASSPRNQARTRMDTRANGAPRDRSLAFDRGSAAAREPRHRRRGRQAHAQYTETNSEAKKRLYAKVKATAREARHEPGSPDPPVRLRQE